MNVCTVASGMPNTLSLYIAAANATPQASANGQLATLQTKIDIANRTFVVGELGESCTASCVRLSKVDVGIEPRDAKRCPGGLCLRIVQGVPGLRRAVLGR